MPDCDEEIPEFPLLQLCSDRIDANGVYLMDLPDLILVYVCRSVSAQFCEDVLGVNSFAGVTEMVSAICYGIVVFILTALVCVVICTTLL